MTRRVARCVVRRVARRTAPIPYRRVARRTAPIPYRSVARRMAPIPYRRVARRVAAPWPPMEPPVEPPQVSATAYVAAMRSARFCPVCGGFAPWTPRISEIVRYECVPIVLTPHWRLPFDSTLDWSKFSGRFIVPKFDPAGLAGLKAYAAGLV